jgi:hypothetical protein
MAEQAKEQRKFKILVRDDEIEVAPHVKKAKKVTWMCDEYDWEVKFEEGHPLVEGHFGGKANQEKGSQIRANADAGSYKYTVTVFIEGEPRSKDPELIVDE